MLMWFLVLVNAMTLVLWVYFSREKDKMIDEMFTICDSLLTRAEECKCKD